MKWISVKDRLPEDNQQVLVSYGGTDAIDIRIFFKDIDLWSDLHVTHWMPLPEAPNNELSELEKDNDGRVRVICDRFQCNQPIWIREYSLHFVREGTHLRGNFCVACCHTIYNYVDSVIELGWDNRPREKIIEDACSLFKRSDCRSVKWKDHVSRDRL
jgi:hypothetical protein